MNKIINTAALKRLLISIWNAYKKAWLKLTPDEYSSILLFQCIHVVIVGILIGTVIIVFPIILLIIPIGITYILLKSIKRGYQDFEKENNSQK